MIAFRPLLFALLPVALCVALLATIFFNLLDRQWIAFLSGILVAAVLAVSSKATVAQWRIARRDRRIDRLKEKVSCQSALQRADDAQASADQERNRLLYDAVDCMLVYVDVNQFCLFHNLAFAGAAGPPGAQVTGKNLRDVLGSAAHSKISAALERILRSKDLKSEKLLQAVLFTPAPVTVRLIPNCRADGEVLGCWILLEETAAPVSARTRERNAATGENTGTVGSEENTAASARYLQSMSEDLTGWNDPKAHFLEALERDRFCLLYQPIQRALPGLPGPEYAEILVRLREEKESLLPPGAFFPVGEHYHLMAALDRWVLSALLDWYKNKRRPGLFMRFCVNLSSETLNDEGFAPFLRKEIEIHGLPGLALCFELAEVDVIAHQADAVRLTGEIAALGGEVTIDGFGGSSSSFTYLQGMAVNFIKIDGGIIANIHRDPVSLAKARAITRAAHLTKRQTIAEFVETQETLKLLQDLGVDYVQGFGIARPRDLSDLARSGVDEDGVGLDRLAPSGSSTMALTAPPVVAPEDTATRPITALPRAV